MLYHLALVSDWEAAIAEGAYRVSTLGRSLADEGFVHAAFDHQVRGVAERFYAAVREPLVLLLVDERRLSSPWQVDDVPGAGEGFPHVYGPIDLTAVVATSTVVRDRDGTWHGLGVIGGAPA
ncbi:MAG TPA: DUF952 domain-containing protein [Kineosporiaceae bacterium]